MGPEAYIKILKKVNHSTFGLHERKNFRQCFIILDEAQNTTPAQMKMFLTRIGFGSK